MGLDDRMTKPWLIASLRIRRLKIPGSQGYILLAYALAPSLFIARHLRPCKHRAEPNRNMCMVAHAPVQLQDMLVTSVISSFRHPTNLPGPSSSFWILHQPASAYTMVTSLIRHYHLGHPPSCFFRCCSVISYHSPFSFSHSPWHPSWPNNHIP
jgi:hypothetical protein